MILKTCNYDVNHTIELLDISKQTFYKTISYNKNGEPELVPIGRPRKLGSTHYFTSMFWFI
jgi:hypothetical protein